MTKLINYFVTSLACTSILIACNSNSKPSDQAGSSMSSESRVDSSMIATDSAGVVKTPPTNDANVVMTGDDFISKNITDNNGS